MQVMFIFFNTVWENDHMGTFPPNDLLFALLHAHRWRGF